MSALLALAAAIGWGSSDFAAGYASRKSSAVSVVILTHLAAAIALLCVALDFTPVWTMLGDVVATLGPGDASGPIRWAAPAVAGSPTAADISWGIAAGLGGGAGAMLLFRGLGKGSMAVVAPITAAGAATIPVLFGLATGDPVTTVGIVGIALALVAIVLVSLGGDDELDVADLTVPEAWSTQFRLPPPTAPLSPADVAGAPTPRVDESAAPGQPDEVAAPPVQPVEMAAPPVQPADWRAGPSPTAPPRPLAPAPTGSAPPPPPPAPGTPVRFVATPPLPPAMMQAPARPVAIAPAPRHDAPPPPPPSGIVPSTRHSAIVPPPPQRAIVAAPRATVVPPPPPPPSTVVPPPPSGASSRPTVVPPPPPGAPTSPARPMAVPPPPPPVSVASPPTLSTAVPPPPPPPIAPMRSAVPPPPGPTTLPVERADDVPPPPPAARRAPEPAATAPTPTPVAMPVATAVAVLDEPAPPDPQPVAAETDVPVSSRVRLGDDELRMPVRTLRRAVLALVGTAVLAAAAIASGPIGALADGSELSAEKMAALVLALAIVGLAAGALQRVIPLFEFTDLRARRDGSPASQDGAESAPIRTAIAPSSTGATRTAISWRAIVRQPGVPEALLSGIGFGLFFVFIYRAAESAGHWPLVSARVISVVMFVAIALATSVTVLPDRRSRRPVVLAGLLDAAAAVCFVMSTRIGLLSVGAVIAALYPVATVVLARVIAKERVRPKQMVGLVVALAAVVLLAA